VGRKLSKPSLKNYLSTGKVIIEEKQEVGTVSKEADNKENTEEKTFKANKLLGLFSPEDQSIWEPVFTAGAEIVNEKVNLIELRNFFRTMDRVRFTLYILENEKTAMRTIRSGVQIREPFLLFLLWDDTGIASLYTTEENLIL